MAKFTSTAPLNIRWLGNEISGAAGATHRIPDALYEEFNAAYSGVIPGLTWVDTDELAAAGTHLADPTAAHAASAVSFSPTGTVAATDVQAAVAEVASEAATNLSNHTGQSSGAHAASAISISDASNYFTGTTVEAALAEAGAVTSNVNNIRGVVAIPFVFTGTLTGTGTTDLRLADSTNGLTQLRYPFGGSVVAISISLLSARTAGTLTAQVFNGSGSGLYADPAAVIDGTTTNDVRDEAAVGTSTFTSNNYLRCRLTTSSFTPTANAATVVVYLALNVG